MVPTMQPSPLPSPAPSLAPSRIPSPAPSELPSRAPTPAPVSSRRLQAQAQAQAQRRRRLLATTSVSEIVSDALISMNAAIGASLSPGEKLDLSSGNLGMRTEVIDAAHLALQGSAGLSIGTSLSSDNGLPSNVEPSMLLPSTINLTAQVTVAAINYGKFNPYELAGGELPEGSSVNSFSFNGVEVSGLDYPIVLALPLPSSRRRVLSEWNNTFGGKDFAESYSVDCGGKNVSKLEGAYTTQDLARAQFCGTDNLLVNATKWVSTRTKED